MKLNYLSCEAHCLIVELYQQIIKAIRQVEASRAQLCAGCVSRHRGHRVEAQQSGNPIRAIGRPFGGELQPGEASAWRARHINTPSKLLRRSVAGVAEAVCASRCAPATRRRRCPQPTMIRWPPSRPRQKVCVRWLLSARRTHLET